MDKLDGIGFIMKSGFIMDFFVLLLVVVVFVYVVDYVSFICVVDVLGIFILVLL